MNLIYIVFLWILAASTTALAAPGYKTALLSSEGAGAVLAFEMEGVSLLTPHDEIPDILAARGFKQVDSGSPASLRFIKGDYDESTHYATPGGIAYEMLVSTTDRNNTIHFRRMSPRVTVASRGVQPGPLPDALDVELGKELKALICGKIEDETVRHRSCPPNTEMTIPFIGVNRRVRLGDKLFLQRFSMNGHAGTIHLVRHR